MQKITKKYILKEGNHQLIPGGSIYNNDTITDTVAEIIISAQPHTKQFFEKVPRPEKAKVTETVVKEDAN